MDTLNPALRRVRAKGVRGFRCEHAVQLPARVGGGNEGVADLDAALMGQPPAALRRGGRAHGGIRRAVAPVLHAVARNSATAGEPDLSALVVLSDTGLPGRLNGQVVDPQDRRARTAWLAELGPIGQRGQRGSAKAVGRVAQQVPVLT